jgi:hypothetical protein
MVGCCVFAPLFYNQREEEGIQQQSSHILDGTSIQPLTKLKMNNINNNNNNINNNNKSQYNWPNVMYTLLLGN